MEEEKPGFGFRPNDEELVGYYLLNKILGNDILVDGVIRAINNICSIDPWDLRFQSKIKSRDPVWYFLSRRENNGKQNRKTRSGYWKLTGVHGAVKDQWGHVSGARGKKIGEKRVLTFHSGNPESSIVSNSSEKNKSAWVMHELHYTDTGTDLPEDKRTSYVICRLEYKGDDVNILSADPTFAPTMANSASSAVVDQSVQGNSGYYNTLSEYDSAYQLINGNYDTQQSFQGFSGYFNHPTLEYDSAIQAHWSNNLQQQQVPYSAPFQNDWDEQLFQQNLDYLERTFTRDDPSHYRPKKPVTGYFNSSDSDTDSTIGRDDAWSSTDSVGSKDGPHHTPKDDTPSLSSTVEPLLNHEPHEQPKQLELQLQGKDKVMNKQKSECECKMAEDSIKKAPSTSAVKQSWIVLEEMSQRNSRWIYLNNMIIGFLLFISIIVWIILVC